MTVPSAMHISYAQYSRFIMAMIHSQWITVPDWHFCRSRTTLDPPSPFVVCLEPQLRLHSAATHDMKASQMHEHAISQSMWRSYTQGAMVVALILLHCFTLFNKASLARWQNWRIILTDSNGADSARGLSGSWRGPRELAVDLSDI